MTRIGDQSSDVHAYHAAVGVVVGFLYHVAVCAAVHHLQGGQGRQHSIRCVPPAYKTVGNNSPLRPLVLLFATVNLCCLDYLIGLQRAALLRAGSLQGSRCNCMLACKGLGYASH